MRQTGRILMIFGLIVGLVISSQFAVASQDEWEKVMAAAKKEGKVGVMGPLGTDTRDSLTQPFMKKYGITVDYFGGRGGQQSTRAGLERRAGRYIWDVFVGGTTTGLTAMIPMKAFDPLEPALILENVKNPKKWRDGYLEFVDPRREMLVMLPTQRVILSVNPELVKPREFKSYKDLLKPKWKGKIVFADPRRPGSAQATFMFFMLHPELGESFIRKLANHDPVIIGDPALAMDSVTRGKYPILLAPRSTILGDALRRGLPIKIVTPSEIKEGSDISPGAGALAMFNKAPHPNAAKVYINWLLTREGQYGFAKAVGYVSRRLDVPSDYYESWRVPQAGA
nr:extracellular solute-binding protein [Deltaproteobacteria bacterium]